LSQSSIRSKHCNPVCPDVGWHGRSGASSATDTIDPLPNKRRKKQRRLQVCTQRKNHRLSLSGFLFFELPSLNRDCELRESTKSLEEYPSGRASASGLRRRNKSPGTRPSSLSRPAPARIQIGRTSPGEVQIAAIHARMSHPSLVPHCFLTLVFTSSNTGAWHPFSPSQVALACNPSGGIKVAG
jgi:hypothetical protein